MYRGVFVWPVTSSGPGYARFLLSWAYHRIHAYRPQGDFDESRFHWSRGPDVADDFEPMPGVHADEASLGLAGPSHPTPDTQPARVIPRHR
ncbi:hypothetical protein PIB30_051666 [Stylosanthes scabra]|uniref:Uncharacterized protein n=1 Tax=Stylosanthes scabra TaxID=79078 RepID=A0ABU6QHR2_9FABA|nr:hypothetical protein [Stylosanthes scabra]